jgi:hypothetical protein
MKFANFALGASLLVGGFTAPAMAASLTAPTLSGGDVILYNANSTNTYADPSASLSDILTGDATAPTGNVELFASSETLNNASFAAAGATSLSGTLNGKSIVLSSVTATDWSVFGLQWFGKFLDVSLNATGQSVRGIFGDTFLYNTFVGSNGRQLFSDPNISYVNQDDVTGEIKIGLAGHLNAFTRIATQIPALAAYLKPQVQASEIVKVVYDNGPAQYLYSFSATNSGLIELKDKASHSGNYEVAFQGELPPDTESVPEPASVLGLLVVGGLTAASKRKSVA